MNFVRVHKQPLALLFRGTQPWEVNAREAVFFTTRAIPLKPSAQASHIIFDD